MKKFYCYQKLSAPHLFYLQDPETEKEYLAHTKSDIYRDLQVQVKFKNMINVLCVENKNIRKNPKFDSIGRWQPISICDTQQ